MVSRCIGMLLLLATLPALAQAPSATSSLTPDGRIPRQHPPRKVLPGTRPDVYDPINHVTISYNEAWAGYAVTGSNFTQVSGSWTVTAVDCSKTPKSDSSEWVGIDGWTSDTVEQTGTDADCVGSTPSYYVWYEFYPKNTVVISSVSIAPGDNFLASVVYHGGNEYTVSITNTTTNESFSKEVEFSGTKKATPKWNSAEWIMEQDGSELSDFGTDSFGQYYTDITGGNNTATDSSFSGVISGFGSAVQESITTKNGGSGSKETSVPSVLASDGEGYTVTWKAE
jgi:Peptidase A4 family